MTDAPGTNPSPQLPPPWSNLHPSEPTPPSPTHRERRAPAALALVGVVALLAGAAGAAAGVSVADSQGSSSSSAAGTPRPAAGSSQLPQSVDLPDDSSGIDVGSVASSASPAIVNIATTLANGAEAAGSGMVLTSSGQVLTNNHVISGATDIKVEVGVTGKTYSADVVGYDVADDVALIQLAHASGMKTIKTSSSSSVSRNDGVIAIGNALGRFGSPSVVAGTVTALHQQVTAGDGYDQETLSDMIQVAASIQPGDSGGALLNEDGRVIGMNTAANVGGNGFGMQSATMGFAIPIERAVTIAREITSGDSSNGAHIGTRAMLGVVLDDSGSAGTGVPVADVEDGSPAGDAGISAGDEITAVDGHQVSSATELRAVLDQHHPDDDVRVSWTDQSGDNHRATVTLAEGPPA